LIKRRSNAFIKSIALANFTFTVPSQLRFITDDPQVFRSYALISLVVLGVGSFYAILGATKRNKTMSIRVKWGSERLNLPLPPPETTLGELRKLVGEQIHIPPSSFKLIHSGAIMKGDSFPIAAYSVRNGSTIQVVGGQAPIIGRTNNSRIVANAASSKPTEQGVIQTIHNELDQVRKNLAPGVQSFSLVLSDKSNGPPSHADNLKQEHTRLGELLLQSLLRLDAIAPDSEWVDARSARKTAVKEVQNLLTQLDTAWKAART